MTGWMLYVITQIRGGVFNNTQNHQHVNVNNIIKILFTGSTEKELHETLNTFWSKYKNFNNKNYPFDSN